MASDTWTCPQCGVLYPLSEPRCPVCRITQVDRHVTGRIITPPRSEKPPPEKVEIQYPVMIKGARFNVPSAKGPAWTSGSLLIVESGLFLVSEQDSVDAATVAQRPPAAGPFESLSFYVPRGEIGRIVHEKLAGQFVETKAKQKIPLRLEPAGWSDLDVVCDQLEIPRR